MSLTTLVIISAGDKYTSKRKIGHKYTTYRLETNIPKGGWRTNKPQEEEEERVIMRMRRGRKRGERWARRSRTHHSASSEESQDNSLTTPDLWISGGWTFRLAVALLNGWTNEIR